MWTAENRSRYARKSLRYPSDVTDAEWNRVRPFVVDRKHRGSPTPERMRAILDGVLYVLSTGSHGARCRRTCRRRAPCMAGLCAGSVTACSIVCTLRSIRRPANWSGRTPTQRPPVWTVRASRASKRGEAHRSSWIRRGQEGERQEAARHRRHAGSDARPPPRPTSKTGMAFFPS